MTPSKARSRTACPTSVRNRICHARGPSCRARGDCALPHGNCVRTKPSGSARYPRTSSRRRSPSDAGAGMRCPAWCHRRTASIAGLAGPPSDRGHELTPGSRRSPPARTTGYPVMLVGLAGRSRARQTMASVRNLYLFIPLASTIFHCKALDGSRCRRQLLTPTTIIPIPEEPHRVRAPQADGAGPSRCGAVNADPVDDSFHRGPGSAGRRKR